MSAEIKTVMMIATLAAVAPTNGIVDLLLQPETSKTIAELVASGCGAVIAAGMADAEAKEKGQGYRFFVWFVSICAGFWGGAFFAEQAKVIGIDFSKALVGAPQVVVAAGTWFAVKQTARPEIKEWLGNTFPFLSFLKPKTGDNLNDAT
ncbi:MAG: hypothetical protein ACRDBG_28255 [Waterburya sp.]